METPNSLPTEPTPASPRCPLKIFGAGGAGLALLPQLQAAGVLNSEYVVVDSPAPPVMPGTARIEVSKNLLGGHGSHWSEPGKVELEGQARAVREQCANCETVFVLAGLGGRTGSWMSAAIAREARAAGAAVYAFVTLPFDCEGSVRFSKARQALERLVASCDFVFIQPHEDFHGEQSESLSLQEVYTPSNRRVLAAVHHVAAALAGTTLMGIGFGDLCAMLHERGASVMFAVGGNEGENRAGAVLEELLAHPRLKAGKFLAEAETVAVSLAGAQDLRMADVNRVMQELGNHWQGTSHLLSASVSGAGQGKLSALLLIATQTASDANSRPLVPQNRPQPASEAAAFDTHFLSNGNDVPSPPRFTPPSSDSAPVGAPRGRGGRGRNKQSRLHQGQLPLDMANKGRFEKSEPTIHKGEDLDVPTFIRRGVVLN